MTSRKPSKTFVLFGIGLIIASVAAFAIIQSEIAARNYIEELRASASTLRTAMKKLEASVESPLFDASTDTTLTDTSAIKQAKSAVVECRKQINEFSKVSNTLRPLRYATHIGTYAEATILQERAHFAVNQTNDTLARYDDTVAFLEVYTTSLATASEVLDEFNTITDFNTYAGRSDYSRQLAARMQVSTDTLTNRQAPTELTVLKDDTTRTLQQLSDHLTALAYGMDVAVDDTIYGAVKQIEDTNTHLNTITEQTYPTATAQMRVTENIYELDEKLDFILE